MAKAEDMYDAAKEEHDEIYEKAKKNIPKWEEEIKKIRQQK